MEMSSNLFEEVGDGEPHRIRRQQILKKYPNLRNLEGHDTRTAWVTLAVAVLQMGVAWSHGRASAVEHFWGTKPVVFFNAWIFGAVLAHWLGQTIHETSHDLAFQKRFHNKLLALFANLPMILPVAATFHRYHIPHHTFLGVLTRDIGLPHSLEVRFIANNSGHKFAWLLGYGFVYMARVCAFMGDLSRNEIVNALTQIVFTFVTQRAMGWTAVAYLLLSTLLGHSLHPVAAHFVHDHWVFFEGQETNSYYGPLNWLTFNVGYHVEHHDFMGVPGWRLPEVHATAPEFYKPLGSHTSWSYVLFHIITERTAHVGNRIVRSLDTYRSTRVRLAPGMKGNLPTGRGLLGNNVLGEIKEDSALKVN